MNKVIWCCLVAGLIGAILAGAGCMEAAEKAQVNLIYSRGTGPMPTMLATEQIDGYIAWQPFVEVGPVSGIGKILVYSQDMPPKGRWKNHPCCVLVARDDLIAQNPELVDTFGALVILSTQYVREHPDETADIVAEWLAGKGNFTYGNVSVSSVEVMKRAIPTIGFVNEPSEQWIAGNLEFVHALRDLGALTGSLANASDTDARSQLFNTGPYSNAMQLISGGRIRTPTPVAREMGIGYLMSDHHAALFVAVKNWEFFNATYGLCLKPRDRAQARPEIVDFIVNGEKVATFRLISGDAGPQLMQLAATDTIQFAFVGNPPAISAIDKGVPAHILMAVNTEGSGIVLANNAPAHDWESFVAWVRERSERGDPVKLAAPGKGSIQDVMLRYALEDSRIQVSEVS